MSPRSSGRAAAFDRAAYEQSVAAFLAESGDARYQHLAGLRDELALEPIYERHANLFSRAAVDALRVLVEAAGTDIGRNRTMLAFATDGYIGRQVAALTDAVGIAEATAMVVWRGERLPFRAVANRVAEIDARGERNALFDSYTQAEEAINPIRAERMERTHELAAELGYADYVDLVRMTRGFDPDLLGAEMRAFLAESETPYFAALRRFLARIEIEQGDATGADLWYINRAAGWDHWFDGRRLMPILEQTLRGIGIDLRGYTGATLDVEARPNKSPRAFVSVVNAPHDVRLVIQPRGGWDDYRALFHEAGHLVHFLEVDPALPGSFGELGDAAVSEGYAMTFEHLRSEPAWLQEALGMPLQHAEAFADFSAFFTLSSLRGLAAKHLYELRMHRGGNDALHRADYAGLSSQLKGVREPEARYLAIDDGMYGASYLRCFMVSAQLSDHLKALHGEAWWRSEAAGDALRGLFRRGMTLSAEQLVAHLGYDSLDWRPVVRQVRARLIGEMSGYGGPNITTRAGTRKV